MSARYTLLPALALAAALGGTAAAQTPQPSPEQAQALEAQITDWLKSVTAGAVRLPPRPVQMTAEGDHYLVRIPFGGNVQPADAAYTAKARMLDGTRWALDDERFPDDLTITSAETVSDAPDAKNPSPSGTHTVPVTFHVKLTRQDMHGVFDPTNTQPATNGGTIGAIDIEKTDGIGPSTTHVADLAIQASTRPIDATHLDVVEDVMTGAYSTKTVLPDGSPAAIDAQRVHVAVALSGLAHDKLVPLARSLAQLGQLAKQPSSDAPDGMTPAQRAQLRNVLQAAQSTLTGGKVDETLETVKFNFGGTTGSLAKLGLSLGGDAPQTTLSAQMALTLDGLVVDALPPAMAVYVPSHFAIRPTLSNLDLAALTKMGMDATAPVPAGDAPAVPGPDLQSMFAHGGINVGFDGLELTTAGAQLAGTGRFNVAGPGRITGQADLTATGLDALITKMQADPMMAQGVPIVIFLKGIARTSGTQSVWQVTVDNAKILVNGVDLSALAGAMGK